MADPKKEVFRKQAEHVIANMRKRNIAGIYCKDRFEAVTAICKMIKKDAVVGLGGSTTIVESGLVDALRMMDIRLLDRYRDGISSAEIHKMRREGLSSDVYIASCNAITHDGRLISEDGLGNRVAATIFGPEKVILMVGMNKLVPTVEDGLKRIKTIAAPLNSVRFGADTPCSRTGICDDANCFPPTRICNQIMVIEANAVAERLNVVLVGEELGF